MDLPSARQATNATDSMSHMHAWGRSARRPQEGQGSVGKGRAVAGQKFAPVRIQCKQAGLDQPAERMVMSGDLGSQVCLSFCLLICLSVHAFVCLFVRTSVCLFAQSQATASAWGYIATSNVSWVLPFGCQLRLRRMSATRLPAASCILGVVLEGHSLQPETWWVCPWKLAGTFSSQRRPYLGVCMNYVLQQHCTCARRS